MKTNDSPNACPKCGAAVPPEAPQGLCPKCVLAQAVAPEAAPTATANIPSLERLAVAFPQLQIIELIGRGGMGFVFKARQPHLDRFVALKLLPDSLAHDPHFAERFNREGRTLARLNHPNIVSVFDFGQSGGFYYLLMECVDGVNLRQAMQAGRFSPSEALAIVPKICEALQYAHEEGVLHRDIKPENILLDAKGRVKIADFGIAKIVGDEKPDISLTATGAALGTPHYMAPEQFEKPATVDHRADIYSLGVVFYELLTGELPIGRFALPSQKTPVDPRVDEVVMRTLEKEREKRFQSAGEMKTNVEHLTEAGAGAFKGMPRTERVPHGTMVINPSAVISPEPKWSFKSVWAAVLTGLSIPVPMLFAVLLYLSRGHLGGWVILGGCVAILPGLAGTILGWMGLSDIRASQGRLRGLPLALFAALTLPLFVLGAIALVLPWFVAYQPTNTHATTFSTLLMLLIPAGAITFIVWAIYAAARWGANKPAGHRRGALKWVFIGLLLFGFAAVLLRTARPGKQIHDITKTSPEGTGETNFTPWIRFTFTAVELRELQGVRWLAIDYLDDVHGECQKSFPWENTIPGFRATTRSSEFINESKDSSPEVRHQRIEYRMPDSSPRDQLERLRDNLEKALVRKSFRLEFAEDQVSVQLFELPGAEGGSLKAWVKVVDRLSEMPQRSARQANKSSALEFRLIADASDAESLVDELPERHSDGSETKMRVLRTVMLDGSSVARAGIDFDVRGNRGISVELTTEGARQFGAITAANVNRQLAIVSSGKVLSAPVIRSPITGGEVKISSDMPAAEMHKLVAALNKKPAGLEFAPAVERSLPRPTPSTLEGIFLDLDSGAYVTNHLSNPDRSEREWLRTNGVDLLVLGNANQPRVIKAFDSGLIEAPANAWDSIPPEEVGWNWKLMRGAATQDSTVAPGAGGSDVFMFRTRENGFGLLQFLPETNPAADVKIRYKLVQGGRSTTNGAATEMWSPSLASGERPVPYTILQEAASLTRQGRYEEALQRHIWYHRHALEFQPSQVGVRLSFAVEQWMDLARRYPKAKDALVEIRDQVARDFSDRGGDFSLFMEASFINKALKEDYATVELFKSIQTRNPKLVRQCYQLVEDALVETGEYAVCEGFIPDVQARFDEIRAKREKFLVEARNPKAAPNALRQVAQQTFIKETRSLVEILVGVGRGAEAEAIRDQAVAVLDKPELQSAVRDAEARVAAFHARQRKL